MARKNKTIRIAKLPKVSVFQPQQKDNHQKMILTLEEYEMIRMLDYFGYTQQQCADQLNVSRATVQSLYMQARQKVARFLVEGMTLEISGGNYEVGSYATQNSMMSTQNRQPGLNEQICQMRQNGLTGQSVKIGQNGQTGQNGLTWKNGQIRQSDSPGWNGESRPADNATYKETIEFRRNKAMIIAVTYENGQVFQHFGHTEQFKVYQVENNKIVSTKIVDTNGQGHGALADFLFQGGVDILICGGIGGGARNALANAGIQLYPGASGDADAQVASFIEGNLNYDPNTTCSHHGEHGEGHDCGGHVEGHSCGNN